MSEAGGRGAAHRYLSRLLPLLRERGVEIILAGLRSLTLHDAWQAAGFEAIHLDFPFAGWRRWPEALSCSVAS
jgi:hypothetical protein